MATEMITNLPWKAAEGLARYKRRHGHQVAIVSEDGGRAALVITYKPGSKEAARVKAEAKERAAG